MRNKRFSECSSFVSSPLVGMRVLPSAIYFSSQSRWDKKASLRGPLSQTNGRGSICDISRMGEGKSLHTFFYIYFLFPLSSGGLFLVMKVWTIMTLEPTRFKGRKEKIRPVVSVASLPSKWTIRLYCLLSSHPSRKGRSCEFRSSFCSFQWKRKDQGEN